MPHAIQRQRAVPSQQKVLARYEEMIEHDLYAFVRVGGALATIRDGRLYHVDNGGEYTRFEDYCRGRWGWGRHYANRLIGAVVVKAAVEEHLGDNCHQTPSNEAQVRPLLKLKTPELQAQAWERAVETAETDSRPIIASDVKAAVVEVVGETVEEAPKTPKVPDLPDLRTHRLLKRKSPECISVCIRKLEVVTEGMEKYFQYLDGDPRQDEWVKQARKSRLMLTRFIRWCEAQQ